MPSPHNKCPVGSASVKHTGTTVVDGSASGVRSAAGSSGGTGSDGGARDGSGGQRGPGRRVRSSAQIAQSFRAARGE